MLQSQCKQQRDYCKDFFTRNRFEEVMQTYEDPMKALVHRALEAYIEEAFEEFIGEKIGKPVVRASDGAVIKEYRNGYRYIKHSMIGTLLLNDIRVPRNRAGGFRPDILMRMRKQVGKIALLISSLYINGVSTRKIRRSLGKAGIRLKGISRSSVSRVVSQLVKEYIEWINRPITREFIYIQVDTVYTSLRKWKYGRVGLIVPLQ